VKRREKGFTLVELLTTVGIVTILIALLIPAINMVHKMAKEAEQKAQFNTIGLALEAFKIDYGAYPESTWLSSIPANIDVSYQGAQRLTEALVGMDLMGFHPESTWLSTGRDENNNLIYLLPGHGFNQLQIEENLKKRRGPYLDNPTSYAFRLIDLFDDTSNIPSLNPYTYVLCDTFKARRINIQGLTGETINARAGSPILYFKADTSSKVMSFTQDSIYDHKDNMMYFQLPPLGDVDKPPASRQTHRLGGNPMMFYNSGNLPYQTYKIIDPKVTTNLWPHRPDSYILISAGWDGLYGTSDDVLNY
jgi:prepilin-type N-terminal cleavage/methylation domain-containing protein